MKSYFLILSIIIAIMGILALILGAIMAMGTWHSVVVLVVGLIGIWLAVKK